MTDPSEKRADTAPSGQSSNLREKIMASFASLPPTNAPVYSTPNPDDAVELYSGPMVLEQDGKRIAQSGTVSLEWVRFPKVAFRITDPSMILSIKPGKATLHLESLHQQLEADIRAIHPQATRMSASTQIDGGFDQSITISGEQDIHSILFHIPNFWQFFGDAVRLGDKNAYARHRAAASFDDWRLTIDRITGNAPSEIALKESGGYALTHVGKLEKLDGSSFDWDAAMEVLRALHWFLSFCRGFWTTPLLPVGLDQAGRRMCEAWFVRRADRFKVLGTWFNTLSNEGITNALPGFFKRWDEVPWKDATKQAIHWYVEANAGAGTEVGAIILEQAGLELLAWTLLVEDRRVLSKNGFKKLAASDRLRLFLSTLGLPLEIDASMTALAGIAAKYGWADAPEALCGIRNAIVHPDADKRASILGDDGEASFEAWWLGLWYLELTLLHLFDYHGSYSNRLLRNVWRGQEVTPVPWAQL